MAHRRDNSARPKTWKKNLDNRRIVTIPYISYHLRHVTSGWKGPAPASSHGSMNWASKREILKRGFKGDGTAFLSRSPLEWHRDLETAPALCSPSLRVIASHVHYGTDGTAHLVSSVCIVHLPEIIGGMKYDPLHTMRVLRPTPPPPASPFCGAVGAVAHRHVSHDSHEWRHKCQWGQSRRCHSNSRPLSVFASSPFHFMAYLLPHSHSENYYWICWQTNPVSVASSNTPFDLELTQWAIVLH